MTVQKYQKNTKIWECVCLLFLCLYPLRHVWIGGDLGDTGYSYANFMYFGTQHVDPMWLFATYLANVCGHLFTLLPFGNTLIGLNVYTGLLVSGLAIGGYLFATRCLAVPGWTAFLGEWIAISFCWCPTAKLYDYLSFVLFFACVILLYQGLLQERHSFLLLAGLCLGLNVFVRFSNLPQAALIVAVWIYAVWAERETPKKIPAREMLSNCFMRGLGYTEWCLGGYLLAVIGMFLILHIRYGLPDYFQGIFQLFAMTESATDYRATAMIALIVHTYLQNTYWMIRLLCIGAVGMLLSSAWQMVCRKLQWVSKRPRVVSFFTCVMRVLWGVVCAGTVGWLWKRHFFSFFYRSYDSMILPAILFLMLSMLIACIQIFFGEKQEKLLGVLVCLIVLLTSVGSNNGVYPSVNNLFLVAPYTVGQCLRFVRKVTPFAVGRIGLICDPTALKGVLCTFLCLVLVQSVLFGVFFVFAEGTGIPKPTAQVRDNPVLAGVRMDQERASSLQEISDYVRLHQLRGKEVILYGNMPSLSFYLQMPAAFNSWPDLPSYHLETMQQRMEELQTQMEEKDRERPVIIAPKRYELYMQGGKEALAGGGFSVEDIDGIMNDPKWRMITDFMIDFEYEVTYRNERFTIWE